MKGYRWMPEGPEAWGLQGRSYGRTHLEVRDQSKHQVGEGFSHSQPGGDLGVQQALDWLLSQGCGSPYELLMAQCHNRYICQRSLQGPHTLLLGHQAAHGAVHLWNQVGLPRGKGQGQPVLLHLPPRDPGRWEAWLSPSADNSSTQKVGSRETRPSGWLPCPLLPPRARQKTPQQSLRVGGQRRVHGGSRQGAEEGCREDLIGEVALAGHSGEPQNPLQSLEHAQPWGQGQRLQHRGLPLEEELLQHR